MAPKAKRRVGSVASDYTPQENDGEIWIRRFRDPSTQIRICPAVTENEAGELVYGTNAWTSAREHFDDGVGSFPCAHEKLAADDKNNDCVGCNDSSDKVKKRTRTYYINALDSKGNLRVYKLGSTLYKTFQAREQRQIGLDPTNLQPLSDRDYIINKMGKGLDTTYDPESGDKYPVDFPEQLYDIPEILGELLDKAEAAYGGEEPISRPAAKADVQDDVPAERPAARPAAKTAAKKAAAPREEEPEEAVALPAEPTDEDFDNADTGDIKAWLDERGTEYPSRAPRQRLVAIAKEARDTPPY